MSNQPTKSKFKWVEKLRNIKHIEIYITVIFAIVLVLIFFSSTGNKKSTRSSINTYKEEQTTVTSYIDNIETKLEEILSKVQGASNVSVMVTLDMANAVVKDNILETSSFPDVKGVLIVANGVENTMVKMNILKAVQSVIDISSGRIEILSSN